MLEEGQNMAYQRTSPTQKKKKHASQSISFFILIIAVIVISSNLRGQNSGKTLEKIKASYPLVNNIYVEYENESREDKTLESVSLAQVKQAFSPSIHETVSSKSLDLKEMTKVATLSYRRDDKELFKTTLYRDKTGYMYVIYAKSVYVKSKYLSALA